MEGDVGYGTLPGSDGNGGGNDGDNADEELGEVCAATYLSV